MVTQKVVKVVEARVLPMPATVDRAKAIEAELRRLLPPEVVEGVDAKRLELVLRAKDMDSVADCKVWHDRTETIVELTE